MYIKSLLVLEIYRITLLANLHNLKSEFRYVLEIYRITLLAN